MTIRPRLQNGTARSFNLTHTYLDNPAGQPSGSFPISVVVTNVNNVTAFAKTTANTSVAVLNSPSADVVATPGSSRITAGGSTTLNVSFTDKGTRDTHTVDINWGDGTPDTIQRLAPATLSYLTPTPHQYLTALPDNAPYGITVTVTDKDGGVGSASTQVVVANAAADEPGRVPRLGHLRRHDDAVRGLDHGRPGPGVSKRRLHPQRHLRRLGHDRP